MKAQKYLFLAAVFTELSGLLMVIGALIPGTLDPVVSQLFGEAVVLDAPARLGAGIAGAVLTGWAGSLAMLARSLDRLSPHVLGTATAVGVGAWFVLDGLVSVVNGAALNVAGNLIYLVILMVPALMLRNPRGVHQAA